MDVCTLLLIALAFPTANTLGLPTPSFDFPQLSSLPPIPTVSVSLGISVSGPGPISPVPSLPTTTFSPIPEPAPARAANTTQCSSADWKRIALFYIVNYGAHAFTVVTYPGEKTWFTTYSRFIALLLPVSGILKALEILVERSCWTSNPLKQALYARALCHVVKVNDRDAAVTFTAEEKEIHGRVRLPDGYAFQLVGNDIRFDSLEGYPNHLAHSRTSIRSIAAVIQLLFACYTLYRTRGNQIELYGYAAFGLTVIQYLIMSLINLIASVVVPQFPTIFMVRTAVMTEAERENGQFEGVVADLSQERCLEVSLRRRYALWIQGVFVGLVWGAIFMTYGEGLSWNPGTISSRAQEGWTMAWLTSSGVFGSVVNAIGKRMWSRPPRKFGWKSKEFRWEVLWFLVPLCFGVPAIGGLVVVGQMMAAHGNCGNLSL